MASNTKEQSEREEGEIIEDEFEDISDNSIILTTTGKCISPKEHLPDISLSSFSETEHIEKYRPQRYETPKRRKTHRKRKYSHRKSISVESDSDQYAELDRKLLRAAIHIDTSNCLRNSLHTRLKAMTNTEVNLNKISEDDQIHIPHNISSDEDEDLIQLRLEALRTAVLNKYNRRKKIKQKVISENDSCEGLFFDISEKINDKENTAVSSNEIIEDHRESISSEMSSRNKEESDSVTLNTASQEEDEDVLRALLLASLSKKISDNNMVHIEIPSSQKIDEIYSFNKTAQKIEKKILNTNPYKTTSLQHKKNLPLQYSKVQPIIIDINCDSDTEEEIPNNSNLRQKRNNLAIENSVEIFLKEQRAKVEAEDIKYYDKKQDNFNKSSLKLLPKIKQIEYHNLLKKLQDAQALKQKQKLKQRNSNENKLLNCVSMQKHGEHLKKTVSTQRLGEYKTVNMTPSPYSEQIPDLRNEVRILHKVLKEIQMQKSKR